MTPDAKLFVPAGRSLVPVDEQIERFAAADLRAELAWAKSRKRPVPTDLELSPHELMKHAFVMGYACGREAERTPRDASPSCQHPSEMLLQFTARLLGQSGFATFPSESPESVTVVTATGHSFTLTITDEDGQ